MTAPAPTSDSSTTGKAAELTLAGLFEGLRDSYIKLAKQYRVDIKANFGEDVLELIEETWRKSEALATKDAETKHRIENIRNGLNQIRKELAADLGNIKRPVISRTKTTLINQRIAELDVLLSDAEALLTKPADGEDEKE